VTAADLPYGPVVSLFEDSMVRAVRSKILGPLFAAQQAAPRITKPGSITFTSGIAASRPAPGGALAATVNGALESMVLALALELAPIRVNAVSPGWVDTPCGTGWPRPMSRTPGWPTWPPACPRAVSAVPRTSRMPSPS
jgi:NAD(P)-dependent dehydrogenase (short-subunit alcohol dehydrogenase family)